MLKLRRIGVEKYGLLRKLPSTSLIDGHSATVEIVPQFLKPICAS
jgi:hypothetical protein